MLPCAKTCVENIASALLALVCCLCLSFSVSFLAPLPFSLSLQLFLFNVSHNVSTFISGIPPHPLLHSRLKSALVKTRGAFHTPQKTRRNDGFCECCSRHRGDHVHSTGQRWREILSLRIETSSSTFCFKPFTACVDSGRQTSTSKPYVDDAQEEKKNLQKKREK